MPLSKDLPGFIESLNSNRVEYLVVGAFAVAWYGYPRFTAYLDTWAGRVKGHLEGLPATFIGRDALIQNKESTGRAKDLGDVEELRKRKP